jgi:hypothetical protein
MGYGFQAFNLDFSTLFRRCLRRLLRNQQKVVDKSLKRPIYLDTQDDSFVQCVSPNISPFKVTLKQPSKHQKRRIDLGNGQLDI